jgi:hypothetical protein
MTEYKTNFERTKQDPPLPGQGCSLISVLPFAEPKKTETGDTVYGFVKVRGTYAGSHIENDVAIKASHKLIKEFDSQHDIQIVPVGTWVPFSLKNTHVADKIDVKMKDDEIQLRDLAAREKQAKDREATRELKEREADVLSHDIYDNRESLDFYVMKRNVLTNLLDTERGLVAKLEDTRKKLADQSLIAARIDSAHPEYLDQWLDRYNEKRREVRIPDYVEPESDKAWYLEQRTKLN